MSEVSATSSATTEGAASASSSGIKRDRPPGGAPPPDPKRRTGGARHRKVPAKDWFEMGMFRIDETLSPIAEDHDIRPILNGAVHRVQDEYSKPGDTDVKSVSRSALGMAGLLLETETRLLIETAIQLAVVSQASGAYFEPSIATKDGKPVKDGGAVLGLGHIQGAISMLGWAPLESVPDIYKNKQSDKVLRVRAASGRAAAIRALRPSTRRLSLKELAARSVRLSHPEPELHADGGVMHNAQADAGRLTNHFLAIEGTQVKIMRGESQPLYGPAEGAESSMRPPPDNDDLFSDWTYNTSAQMETVLVANKARRALRDIWTQPAGNPTQGYPPSIASVLVLLKSSRTIGKTCSSDFVQALMGDLVLANEVIEGPQASDRKSLMIENSYTAVKCQIGAVKALLENPYTPKSELRVAAVPILHFILLSKYIGGKTSRGLTRGIALRREAASILGALFQEPPEEPRAEFDVMRNVLIAKVVAPLIDQLTDSTPLLTSQIGAILGLGSMGRDIALGALLPIAKTIRDVTQPSTDVTLPGGGTPSPLMKELRGMLRGEYLSIVVSHLAVVEESSLQWILPRKGDRPEGGWGKAATMEWLVELFGPEVELANPAWRSGNL